MTDIVDRLRDRSFAHKIRDPLVEEAADEIERLRNGALERRETVRLTDAEREAIGRSASWLAKAAESRRELHSAGYLLDDAATLRALLERTA